MIPISLPLMTVFGFSALNSFEPAVHLLASLTTISVTTSKLRLGFGMAISFLSLTFTG